MKICFPVFTGSMFRMNGLTCSPLPGKMIQLINLFLSGLKQPIGQLHEVKCGETWCKQTSSRHYFLFPCHLREQTWPSWRRPCPPKSCPGIHQEQPEFMINFHNVPITFIVPTTTGKGGHTAGHLLPACKKQTHGKRRKHPSNGMASGPLQKTWNVWARSVQRINLGRRSWDWWLPGRNSHFLGGKDSFQGHWDFGPFWGVIQQCKLNKWKFWRISLEMVQCLG